MKIKKTALIVVFCAAAAAAAGWTARSYALGSGSSGNWPKQERAAASKSTMSLYDQGVAADKAGDNTAALEYFRKALKKDKNNPEILNMLAHSERKLGMLVEAMDDYWKALKIRPHFPEAREYMGETYIQAALAEISTRKSYGPEGEEGRKALVKAFKDAAASLPGERAPEAAK